MMSEGSCGLRRSIYSNVSLVGVVLVLEAAQQYYAALRRSPHLPHVGHVNARRAWAPSPLRTRHSRARHPPPVRSVTRELPRMQRIRRRRTCTACVEVLESVSET